MAAVLMLASVHAEETNTPILSIESGGHTAICRWLAFTPDGRELVSAGDDKVIRIWDLREVIRAYYQTNSETSNAPLAKIPLVRSIHLQSDVGTAGIIYAGAISPKALANGEWLMAVGGWGAPNTADHWGDIKLLDLSSGQLLGLLRGHTGTISSLAFSDDGRWLASGGFDENVKVWDLQGQPDDWRKSEDGTLNLPCQTLQGHTENVCGLAFVPQSDQSSTLFSGSFDKTIRLWQRNSSGSWETKHILTNHTAEVRFLSVSPDGKLLASSSYDRTVRLWDAHNGEYQKILGQADSGGLGPAICFTPEGDAVVAAEDDDYGGSHVWRVSDGSELAHFSGHDNSVQAVAVTKIFSTVSEAGDTDHKSGTIVASTDGNNQEIFLWDAATGRKLGQIVGAGRGVFAIGISEDAHWISWGNQATNGNTLKANQPLQSVFDLAEMKPVQKALSEVDWQRAYLSQAGWSAEVDSNSAGILIIRRDDQEVSRIKMGSDYDRVHCYSFVPNGSIIVGSDFHLALYDTATGHQVREFIGHTGPIWAVAVSQDGRLLISGSQDQTIRLWNIATGELLLSFFGSYQADGSVGEWVAWTPAGYYKASPGGDKLIGWQINQGPDKAADFIAAWQMRKLFYRPEIIDWIPTTLSVADAVAKYSSEPNQPREATLNVAEALDRRRPPSVSIYEPGGSYPTVRSNRVHFRAKVWPYRHQAITEVRIMVNGRPPADLPGFDPAKASNPDEPREIETDVPLEPGDDLIELVASTATSTSEPKGVHVICEMPTHGSEPPKPNCYVLGIGVAAFQDNTLNLKYPADDARDVAAAFLPQQGKLFGKVETKLVLNTNATPREIKRGFAWLQKSATQGDLAVVFVSSHGWPNGSQSFYLAPYDFDPDEPTVTGISQSEVQEMLKDLPCKVLLVLDACYSGAAARDLAMAKGVENGVDDVVRDFASVESGVAVICSSTGTELSWENPAWGHGALTLAVIEALTGQTQTSPVVEAVSADSNGDGVLDVDELRTFVATRVKELSGGQQHVVGSMGTSRAFPVAIVGSLKAPDGGLAGARPKYARNETCYIPLASLAAKFRDGLPAAVEDPDLFKAVLKQRYPQASKIIQTAPAELEFEVDGLRGVVSGDPNRWEKLQFYFTITPDDHQVKVVCLGDGYHVKTDSAEPPEPSAFTHSLSLDYMDQLRQEVNGLTSQLCGTLKGEEN